MSGPAATGSGLKAQWGVSDPQAAAAGTPAAGDGASEQRRAFEAAMTAINDSLRAVKVGAEAIVHQQLDAQRQQLVGRYQDALAAAGGAAQAGLDAVVAAATELQAGAERAATQAAEALAQWQARAAAFDAGVAQLTEMVDAGDEQAGPCQAAADAIRARVDARQHAQALAALDGFLSQLAEAHAGFQARQAEAAKAADDAKQAEEPGFLGTLAGAVSSAVGGAADAAGRAAGVVADAAGGVAGAVADTAGRAAGAVADTAGRAAGAVADAAGRVVDTAGRAVDAAADAATDAATGAARAIGQAADRAVDTAADAVIGAATAVGTSADAVGGVIGEVVGATAGAQVAALAGAARGVMQAGPVATAFGAPGLAASAAMEAAAAAPRGAALGQALGGDIGEGLGGLVGKGARWVASAVGEAVGRPPAQPPTALQDRPRSGATIQPAQPQVPLTPVRGADGKTLQIGQAPDGSVTLVAPPPKIETITFSGGGGKGAALPGAVAALEKSGVLDDVKSVSGASVGSMTAALVAAGITAEEFKAIGNDPDVARQISEGKSMPEVLFGGGLTGEGLQDLVGRELTRSVSKRIVEYQQSQAALGLPPDPRVLEIAHKLADGKKGVTFGDLRELSRVMPQIKEVSISGSFMSEVDPETGQPRPGTEQSRLAMFNADTEPDLEIALAVRASAALPPVFNPVDVPLSDGTTGRFQDGGVLNNAPTPESVGAERQIDPIPEHGGMTFVFEDDASRDVTQGRATPGRSRIGDWLTGAEYSAADYAKNRALADRPQDVVMLPLTFTLPPEEPGGDAQERDYTGFGGTLKFDMPEQEKLELQRLADEVTTEHIAGRQAPRALQFASMEQMLMTVPRADLAAMAGDGLAGAQEALDFRDRVSGEVSGLIPLVLEHPDDASAAADPRVREVLARIDALTGGSRERQAVVAREMNRSGRLDGLIQAARGGGASATLQACGAVNDAVRARAHAKEVLRDVIYPKLVRTDADGVDGTLLRLVDDRLRAADSPAAVDDALRRAIDHFRKRSDPLGLKGHREFADELERRLMQP